MQNFQRCPSGFKTKPYLLKTNVPLLDWAAPSKLNVKPHFQFAPNRKIVDTVSLSESGSDSPTSPDMILGCNMICKLLGHDLKLNDDTPAIIWEDVEVPMVPCGQWNPAQIDEAFATILEPPSTYDKQQKASKRKAPVC
jgi:hypothetical protein